VRPDLNAANRPNLPPLHTAAHDGNMNRREELRREEHEQEDRKMAARRVSGDETPRHDNLAETENELRSEGDRSNQDDRFDRGAAARRSDNGFRRRDDGDRFDRDENNNRGEGRAKAPTVSDDIDIDNPRDRPGDLPPSVIVHPLPDAAIKQSIDDMDDRNQHQRGQARRRDQVLPSEDDEDPPEPARYPETARFRQPDFDAMRDRRPQAHDASPRDRARTDVPGRSSSMDIGGRGRAERPRAHFAQDDDHRRANGHGRTIPEDVSELQFDHHPLEPPQAAARESDYHQQRRDDDGRRRSMGPPPPVRRSYRDDGDCDLPEDEPPTRRPPVATRVRGVRRDYETEFEEPPVQYRGRGRDPEPPFNGRADYGYDDDQPHRRSHGSALRFKDDDQPTRRSRSAPLPLGEVYLEDDGSQAYVVDKNRNRLFSIRNQPAQARGFGRSTGMQYSDQRNLDDEADEEGRLARRREPLDHEPNPRWSGRASGSSRYPDNRDPVARRPRENEDFFDEERQPGRRSAASRDSAARLPPIDRNESRPPDRNTFLGSDERRRGYAFSQDDRLRNAIYVKKEDLDYEESDYRRNNFSNSQGFCRSQAYPPSRQHDGTQRSSHDPSVQEFARYERAQGNDSFARTIPQHRAEDTRGYDNSTMKPPPNDASRARATANSRPQSGRVATGSGNAPAAAAAADSEGHRGSRAIRQSHSEEFSVSPSLPSWVQTVSLNFEQDNNTIDSVLDMEVFNNTGGFGDEADNAHRQRHRDRAPQQNGSRNNSSAAARHPNPPEPDQRKPAARDPSRDRR